ncbi:MAG: spore coat protein U domain-containing protein [Polaromonas sp.]|uniref:spore coat protein U domain-containing protein n=1 Tax=Polaromonas sp. TaxID=1869339 RepID=UPI00273197F0|nr:spore coat protein U domain-containing protein [Polaromonas sp.]MDP2257915.1 spore coat protein U domain-containing protein [Polaromonas sp.]
MKHLSNAFKAVVVATLTCAAGLAAAADSQTLGVTASVTATCKFSATNTSLAFGAIDPSLTADKVVTANVLYKCSKGTPSTGVTASGGTSRSMTGPSSDTMAYTLGFSGDTQTGKGFGSGQDLTLVVTGTITAAAYQNASAGAYSENVTLNITP